MVDEEKLLMRLKKKQESALEQAIAAYTPYISTLLFNMAGAQLSAEDREEIVSDVFVILWRNAEYIELSKGSVRSYIAAAARNFALKKLKKTSIHSSIDNIDIPDNKDVIDNSLFSDTLWRYVMELGEPDSEIFVRYYKYNEKLKDIAKITGIKLSTVKTRLSRGRQKLKKKLQILEESL